MHVKLSAGNDCLRFPQVVGGNLSTPAGKLREVFSVPVRSAFFEPGDVFFYPVSNNFTNATICLLPLRSMINSSNLILFQKMDFSLLAFQWVIQNKFQWRTLHYRQNDWELIVVTFWLLSQFSNKRIMSSKQ